MLLFASLLTLLPFASAALTYRGADISSLALVEATGVSYKDTSGSEKSFESILATNGANLARLRIWTAGSYTVDYAIALAKRAKAVGMDIFVDLHYSDTLPTLAGADPSKQAIPSGWPTDLSGLNTKIYNYTKSVVQAFSDAGISITLIQLGNEVTNGLLWPVGKISTAGAGPASELLHSAVSGARAASSSLKTVIHIDNGWDESQQEQWWEEMILPGKLALSDVDIQAVSFYPFYNTEATIANLKSSLTNLVSLYNKSILVAETDFPLSCSGVTLSTSISPGASGQVEWVEEITTVLNGLSGSNGRGVVYWEPGWVGNAGLGSACTSALLVDSSGKAQSSIDMFTSAM